MSTETIANLINGYFKAMASFDSQSWLELFAEDAVTYDPVGNPPSKVHQDYQQFFALLSNLFEQLELSQDNVFIIGNSAAVKWTMRVIDKNKTPASTQGISIFAINDSGKIQQVSSYWYESDLMTQLKN